MYAAGSQDRSIIANGLDLILNGLVFLRLINFDILVEVERAVRDTEEFSRSEDPEVLNQTTLEVRLSIHRDFPCKANVDKVTGLESTLYLRLNVAGNLVENALALVNLHLDCWSRPFVLNERHKADTNFRASNLECKLIRGPIKRETGYLPATSHCLDILCGQQVDCERLSLVWYELQRSDIVSRLEDNFTLPLLFFLRL